MFRNIRYEQSQIYKMYLTSDQFPTIQGLVPAHGPFLWHGSSSLGFSWSLQASSSRAICSSGPRLRTQITVRWCTPVSPQVTEQCCQGPNHHLECFQIDDWLYINFHAALKLWCWPMLSLIQISQKYMIDLTKTSKIAIKCYCVVFLKIAS